MFYDLSANLWNEEEMKAILRVLRTGNFTLGEAVDAFEKQFANKLGSKYAVMTNSGSSANLIAVASLCHKKDRPLQRGDEVIVPAVAWATTYYPLQQYGLKLKFVDIDINTLNIDVTKIEKALTPKTRMIVGVNLFGNPCHMDILRAYCQRQNLFLLEDNCEALGAEHKGKKSGTIGDIGTFSFFFSQHISTMEGGMLITEDREVYHLAKSLRSYGWTRNLPPESPIFDKKDTDFHEDYRFILPGFNVRPLELAGASGSEQLKKLDIFLEIRRQNATLFQERFGNDPRFIIQKEVSKSSWAGFTIILNPDWNISRTKVFDKLRDAQIAFRLIGAGNFTRHDVIKYFDYEKVGELQNADIVHDRGFYVGNYAQNLTKQLDRLQQILNSMPQTLSTPKKSAA